MPIIRLGIVLCPFLLLTAKLHGQFSHQEFGLKNAGHKLHLTLHTPQLRNARPSATVVFESGLGGGEQNWAAVIQQLPTTVRAITYGRPGLDGSEPDHETPTPEHVAQVLHTALHAVASPPYLLVGHSWGGPLARAFAGLFPKETLGMVLVDPTNFAETAAGRKQYIDLPLGLGDRGEQIRADVEAYYASKVGPLDPAVQAEVDESSRDRRSDFKQLNTSPMPDVPVVVLATTNYPAVHDVKLPAPYDQARYQQLTLNYRLISLSLFTRSVTNGTLVTTATSGHYIQRDEPALVTWSINRVLRSAASVK